MPVVLLEPLLPPPVGTPDVPGLEREGEQEVILLRLQERVTPAR